MNFPLQAFNDDSEQYAVVSDTERHLAKPNKVWEGGGQRVEFQPIFQHPFNGWEIVSVEDQRQAESLAEFGEDLQTS